MPNGKALQALIAFNEGLRSSAEWQKLVMLNEEQVKMMMGFSKQLEQLEANPMIAFGRFIKTIPGAAMLLAGIAGGVANLVLAATRLLHGK
jgi:hypothetical protein